MHRIVFFLLVPALARAAPPAGFEPARRLRAVGVSRSGMSGEDLARRTEQMIEAQTFTIMRDRHALEGAQRVLSPKMQKIFQDAAARSGLPAMLISAVAYLESWGVATAQSPAGPRGVMQVASGTAPAMGLRIVYKTRFKVTSVRQRVKTKKGKWVTRTIRRRTRYSVLVKDERLIPERAIPAAANYLARLESKFGGIDWAIFAYHCGEGCVGSMKALVDQARGIDPPFTVPKMFFGGTPAVNRELYQAVWRQMERDFSPTYYFRIIRAQQLLELYRDNPEEFKRLFAEYQWAANPAKRAPNRLAVWLQAKDLLYQNAEDIRGDENNLVPVPDDPDTYGFRLRTDEQEFLRATPAAVGTLMYLAYETRRMFDSMKTREKWVPLEVTSLVRPAEDDAPPVGIDHGSGQVFDIEIGSLPLSEREALDFVLKDMGWSGYLGYAEEGGSTLHIGCAPSARDFFTAVYEESRAGKPSGGLQKQLLDRGPRLFQGVLAGDGEIGEAAGGSHVLFGHGAHGGRVLRQHGFTRAPALHGVAREAPGQAHVVRRVDEDRGAQ